MINNFNQDRTIYKGTTVAELEILESNIYLTTENDSEINNNDRHDDFKEISEQINKLNLENDSDLSQQQQKVFKQFLLKNFDIFAGNTKNPGTNIKVKHHIDVNRNLPIKQRPYRVSQKEEEVIRSEVKQMLENQIIRPSNSPWASPVVLVKKKDGTIRFCVDYRKLNSVTKKDVYPLPRIDDILDKLGKMKYYSSLDLASGYWQIELMEEIKKRQPLSLVLDCSNSM